MSDSRLRFAILGCGNVAQRHAECLAALEGARLVAVADLIAERAEALASRHGARAERSVDALAQSADVDAVLVSTPPALHAALGTRLVERDKHVLLEKPIDLDAEAARALVQLSAERGVRLSVVSQHRFRDDVGWLRALVAEQPLGRPVHVHASSLWSRDQKYYEAAPGRGLTDRADGGVLLNQAVHTVDLMLWMFGPAREVSAQVATLTHRIAVEDSAVVCATLESGALATLVASTSVYPQSSERFEVRFEHGIVVLEGGRVSRIETRPERAQLKPPSAQLPPPDPLDGFRRQYHDFIRAARGESEPCVTGAESCEVLDFIQAAYRSAASGRVVSLRARQGRGRSLAGIGSRPPGPHAPARDRE